MRKRQIKVPPSSLKKAQSGLALLKESILELASANDGLVTNAEASEYLELSSDYNGKQKDYLTYSILGLLMRDGKIEREKGNSKPPILHRIK